MRNLVAFLLALTLFALIHEGAHVATAIVFDEYESFHVRNYGLEVTFKTPVEMRSGFEWALISGISNLLTTSLGYYFYAIRRRFANSSRAIIVGLGYWLTILFLILDPLNLSIGLIIYGGDATGIAVGLNVSRWLVQGIFLAIFLINREIVARNVLPDFGVRANHPMFRPWLPLRGQPFE